VDDSEPEGVLVERWPKLLSVPQDQREPEPLMGIAVSEDELWACTSCMPARRRVGLHSALSWIMELRRHLVLMVSKIPSEGKLICRSLQNHKNPWGFPQGLRKKAPRTWE